MLVLVLLLLGRNFFGKTEGLDFGLSMMIDVWTEALDLSIRLCWFCGSLIVLSYYILLLN